MQSHLRIATMLSQENMSMELRGRHDGEPENLIEFTVGPDRSVGGDPGPMEFELDPAVESGPQRGLFDFTRWVTRAWLAVMMILH